MPRRYRDNHTDAERLAISTKALARRPEACAVVIEPHSANETPMTCGAKFLLVRDLTMAQVMATIRRKLGKDFGPEKALWLFIEGEDGAKMLVEGSKTVGTYYDEYKFPDGFLYIIYTEENAFGGY